VVQHAPETNATTTGRLPVMGAPPSFQTWGVSMSTGAKQGYPRALAHWLVTVPRKIDGISNSSRTTVRSSIAETSIALSAISFVPIVTLSKTSNPLSRAGPGLEG